MRNSSELERAYVAGIIDGEGSINYSGETLYKIYVTVTNTDSALIEYLHELFGGSICTAIQSKSLLNCRPSRMRKPVFQWKVYCNGAEKVLNDVLPFLKVKQKQAQAALKLREIVRETKPFNAKNGVSQAGMKRRKLCTALLSRLNMKGTLLAWS